MRLMKLMSRGVSFITRFCPACVTLILHFTLFNIREKKDFPRDFMYFLLFC